MGKPNRIQEDYLFSHDLPHEHTLDELGLELSDLNAHLQADIRHIDDLFEKALKDGYVDEKEEQELITKSYKLAQKIEEFHANRSNGNSSGLGIIAGITFFTGAIIGIKQLTK